MIEVNRKGEVWVFAEQEDGVLHDVALELCGRARQLAAQLDVKVGAVLAGGKVRTLADRLIAHGADIVYLVEDDRLEHYQTLPYARIVCTLIEKHRPQIVTLRRHTSWARSGAADRFSDESRADGRLHRSADRRRHRAEDEAGPQEPAASDSTCVRRQHHRHDRQLRSLAADGHRSRGCHALARTRRSGAAARSSRKGSRSTAAISRCTYIERHREERKVNLKAARTIVAGGGGVGSKDNFRLIHELAGAIGGAVGASRAAVDGGFIGKEHQVGQTGTTVRPALYIACGISGAVQHRAGMEESAKIIAINTDREAPIFSVAHYGIVGDLNEVIPRMIKAIRERATDDTPGSQDGS